MEPTTPATPPMQTQIAKLPSAFSLFKPSMRALRLNLATFVLLSVIPIAIIVVVFGLLLAGFKLSDGNLSSTGGNVLLIVSLMLFVVGYLVFGMMITVALLATSLKGAEGVQLKLGAAFDYGKRLWFRLLVVMLATGLLIVIGLVLLIVPGLFMLKRYYLAPYYMVDRNLRPLEAMKQSSADSKRFGGAIWGMLGVTLLIGLIGIIPLIGWLASIIMSVLYYCAPAVRYLQIKNATMPRQAVPQQEPMISQMPPSNPTPPTPFVA